MEVISRTIEVKGLKVVIDDFSKLADEVKKIDALLENSAFGTAQFEKLIKLMNTLSPASESASKGVSNIAKASQNAGDQMKTLTQTASALKKEISQLENKNLQGLSAPGDAAQIKKLQKELAIVLATQKESRAEQRKLTNELVAGGKAGAGAYKQLSTQLNLLRGKYKDLAAAGLGGTKEAKLLKKEIGQLDTKLKSIDASVGQFQRNVGNYTSAFKGFGKTLLASFGIIGAKNLIVNGIKNAVKNIGAFDESVADLQKVTQTTKEEATALAKTLFNIDTRTSVSSLLELATAAGRLGLQGSDVTDFVEATDKAFVALGDSLDGSAEEIGLTLGKIGSNFGIEEEFGISESINKIGSVLNDLGAQSKAQEGPIVDFTNRLAGVATQAGLTVPQVASLGALFNESGQSVEVAATTLNKLLPALAANKEEFAEIAGKTLPEFTKILKNDGFEALTLVAKGAQSNKEGLVGLNEVMEDFGIESGRAAGIVGVLAGQTDRLGELQTIANQAFKDGTSLTDEFNIKNETLGANIEKLGNSWEKFTLSVVDGNGKLGGALKRITGFFTDILDNAALLERNSGRLDRSNERGTTDTGFFTTGADKADIIRALDESEKLFNDSIKSQIDSQEKLDQLLADDSRLQKAIEFYKDLGFTQEEAEKKTNALTSSISKSFEQVSASKKKVKANKEEAGSITDLTNKISALQKKLKDENLSDPELKKALSDITSFEEDLAKVDARIEKIKRNLSGVGGQAPIESIATLDVPSAVSSVSGQPISPLGEAGLVGQDADRINQKLVDSAAKSGKAAGEAFAKNQNEALQQAIEDRFKIIEAAQFGLDALSQGLAAFENLKNVEDQNEIKSIESKYAKELELAAGNATAIAELEEKKDQEIEKVQRKQFERTKKLQIAQAAIAGAQAILSTVAAAPGFTDIATFGILRIASIALTAGVVAAQIAAINAQQFEQGGYIDSKGNIIGKSHRDGGVDLNISGRPVNAEGGEKFMQFGDGSSAIITKKAGPSFAFLSDVEKSSLSPSSKKIIASMTNAKAGGLDFAKLPNKSRGGQAYAMEGGIFAPQTRSPLFPTTTKVEISKEAIKEMAMEVGRQAGASVERGANRGITTSTEKAVKLANLKKGARV